MNDDGQTNGHWKLTATTFSAPRIATQSELKPRTCNLQPENKYLFSGCRFSAAVLARIAIRRLQLILKDH
jgi:hypothetical protein